MKLTTLLTATLIGATAQAATFDGNITDWKKDEAVRFSNAEANFKTVFKTIHDNYDDSSITDDDLYRAATAGLLAGLNTGDETWNRLYSPREVEDLKIELSGQLTGIGAVLAWEDETGHAKVEAVLPGSAAQKAGLKKGDVILTVNGRKFKGQKLPDMVEVIRGKSGESLSLKVLSDDDVKTMKITRASVQIEDCGARKIGATTGFLRINAFTTKTPDHVRAKLNDLSGVKKLIVDLRDNQGGGFDQALRVVDFFAAKDSVIAKTKARQGATKDYRGTASPWSLETRIVVLVSKETSSGAELLAASLQENRKALLVGATTHGKWSVQSVETLPNHFAIKYSILQFESPSGKSYQGVGLKPDFEVAAAKDGAKVFDLADPKLEEHDPQIKAAMAL